MAQSITPAKAPFLEGNQGDRVLRLPEVLHRTGLCKSLVYDLAKKGKFPPRIKLGARSSGWMESEISAWIEDRRACRQEA